MTPLCRIFGHLSVGICYRRTPVIYFITSTMVSMSRTELMKLEEQSKSRRLADYRSNIQEAFAKESVPIWIIFEVKC